MWRAVTLVRDYNGDLAKTAAHLSWPEFKVKAALNYAEAFPQEIEDALAAARTCDFDKLKRMIPSYQHTLLTHMAALASEDLAHGGIIVVDEQTIRQRDIGGLVKALGWLWNAKSQADWTNRTVYLRSARHA